MIPEKVLKEIMENEIRGFYLKLSRNKSEAKIMVDLAEF